METKRIKAEMWDKMQYLFRNYYDRMVHAVLYYDGKIDVNILKQVLVYMTEKAPVLHSEFVDNKVHPYWKIRDYKIDDILKYTKSENLENDINSFITEMIPITNNVQYQVRLFDDGKKSVFCMLINHMCFDGGDTKYFLKKMAENYNKLLNKQYNLELKAGDRGYKQVYTKLESEDIKIAKGLYKNVSVVKDAHTFPVTEPSDGDISRILREKIDRETFQKFKEKGKEWNVTINDSLLAVYIHTLYQIGDYPKDEKVSIPCMVDLRRHIKGGIDAGGLTNHTGFMVVSTKKRGYTLKETLIEVLRSVKDSKRDRFLGLYSLPLLSLAYIIFPHIISEVAIKIGYYNPLIGMSNIGIINTEELKLGNNNLIDGFMTGGIKYKPYMQLALTTLNDEITMTVAMRCNDNDEEIINNFFQRFKENMNKFIAE
ncbi:MAG: condensation domain-containing protein [Clostridia bacterium]